MAASFWLVDAPDSLSAQSHRNPDGTGLGSFDAAGAAEIDKAPISAFSDAAFARDARTVRSATFVAHIRFATTGAPKMANTQPFELRRRLFAHNGVVGELPRLEANLGADRSLVRGDTDSERLFALITREIDERGRDLPAAIAAAVGWVADNLPVYAANLVLTTATDLYALRYPATHDLYVLERKAGGHRIRSALRHASSLGSHVHADAPAQRPVVVVASEPMDDDPGWRTLAPGELLHVSRDLRVNSHIAITKSPARLLTLADLGEHARASQAPRA